MSMKKALPIGIEFFEEMITKDYFYIDKTLFIKEILDMKSKVTLITRPRRFGKTLNMSMLRCFLDVHQEQRELFDGFKIMQYQDIVETYQNKHPVILLSLKSIKEPTYDESLMSLGRLISNLYYEYQYIYDSDMLYEGQKKDFLTITMKEANPTELKYSLKELMGYLYAYHKKKVIVIIDEYDAPIDNAEIKGYYPEMVEFIRGFLGDALKGNEYLEFSVITGVQRIAKEGLFSDLNNLKVCSISDDWLEDSFGFTKEEVYAACKYYGMQDDMKEIKAFYDGYLFGRKEMYNPWSILNYLAEGKMDAYWVNTASMGILGNIFVKGSYKLKAMMEGLLMDEPVKMKIGDHITYPIRYEKSDALWTLLLNAGYLKIKDTIPSDLFPEYMAVLVNNEVKAAFRYCIRQWMSNTRDEFAEGLNDFIEALADGDAEGMEVALNEELLYSPSYYDMVNENSFHMFILGILQVVGGTYMIRSNREEHKGRADCTMRPHDKNKAAVVIEFKHVKDKDATEDMIAQSAKEGLEQIKEKSYTEDMKVEGYNTVYEYGIAFSGKYCVVKGWADWDEIR